MSIKETGCEDVDSCGSGEGPLTALSEHGKEP